MKYTFLLLLALIIIIGCSENSKINKTEVIAEIAQTLLSERNLPIQIFKLDINADNSLITQSGVIVQIPKGSLVSDKNPVELEIQEALTMKDIFIAGLQTISNGEVLSSGGMIYINAKTGYNVTIKEKLKMFVPTQNYNQNMQVYQGVKDSSGNINWVNPTPIPKTKVTKRISHGEQLFMSNCASCHAVHKNSTGPALYNVQNRRPKKWLYDFTRNSAACIAKSGAAQPQMKINSDTATLNQLSGDVKMELASIHDTSSNIDYYSRCIFDAWNKTAMTSFPELSDKDLEDLYTYVKLESDKRPELAEKFKRNCCDSCEIYKKAIDLERQALAKIYLEQEKLFSIQQTITLNKNKLMSQQRNAVIFEEKKPITPTATRNTQTGQAVLQLNFVEPELYTGVYYELEISTFGWTNIDVLLGTVADIQQSTLWVRVPESSTFQMRIQLLIPSLKVSMVGGRVNGDLFALKTKDGMIELPLGRTCYIVAISEKDDKLFFDIKQFTSAPDQTIELKLLESDTAKINAALNNLNADGLVSKLGKKAHIDEIRVLDKNIEKIQNSIIKFDAIRDSVMINMQKLERLKPKNCGCDDSNPGSEIPVAAPPAQLK